MKGTTPNSAPHEGLGCGSSANLSFFMMWGSKVIFSWVSYYFKNTSSCLRASVRVVTYELVCGLRDCSDTYSEEFCRNLSHWSHLCAFFFIIDLTVPLSRIASHWRKCTIKKQHQMVQRQAGYYCIAHSVSILAKLITTHWIFVDVSCIEYYANLLEYCSI
jgi:hypothetical protein